MTIRYPIAHPPEAGEPCHIASGIMWFRMPLPMALDHVNIYVLDDGDGWCVIDTGLYTKKTVQIWEAMLEGPLKGKKVTRVIGTHHHPDHIGLAGWFVQEHGAELLMSRTSWLMARMLRLDAQDRPDEKTVAFWTRAGMDQEAIDTRIKERPFNFSDCVYPLPLGFTRLVDDQSLEIAGRHWTVRLGGGHAPDHVTLWSQSDNLVVSADQIIPSISSNIGVYATEPMADPLQDWITSCERFYALASNDMLTLPGHKLPFEGLKTRLRQLIDNHDGVLNRLRAQMHSPKSAAECFDAIFKRPIQSGEYGLALVEAVAHLNYLYFRQEVTFQEENGVRRFVAV